MLAFPDAAEAIEWAVVLQLALLRVQWSQEVLQTKVRGEGDQGVRRGRECTFLDLWPVSHCLAGGKVESQTLTLNP